MNLLYGELSKWKSFRKYAFSISLFLALGSPVNAATVSSPDGRLVLTIETTADGTSPPTPHLVYQLSFSGKKLVEPSALLLDSEGQPPLGSNMEMVNTTASSEDRIYKLVTGKASQVRDHYKALRVDLQENSGLGRKLTIEARRQSMLAKEQRFIDRFRTHAAKAATSTVLANLRRSWPLQAVITGREVR